MATHTMTQALHKNFLGQSPGWYKTTIIAFLVLNPILFLTVHPFIAGWVLVLEFIFTLAMALKCYPLQPGGLLAAEAIIIGMATPSMVLHEPRRLNLKVVRASGDEARAHEALLDQMQESGDCLYRGK